MDIRYQDIIKLDDENEYVVAGKVNLKNKNYIYLVDINNNSNLKFAEIGEQGYIYELDTEKEKYLIQSLIPTFYNNSKNDILN